MTKLVTLFYEEVRAEVLSGTPMQRGFNLVCGFFVLACSAWVAFHTMDAMRSFFH